MVGGEDLADMPAAWVRDHVGVVLQEPFLFSRTIEENIGICGADRETVRKAAATACIGALPGALSLPPLRPTPSGTSRKLPCWSV